MAARRRFFDIENEETEPLYGSTTMQEQHVKEWNTFKDIPREPTVGSTAETKYLDNGVKVMKIVTYVGVCLVVLGAAVVSKGTTLFMVSQIRKNVTRAYCNAKLDKSAQFLVTIPEVERVTWIWFLIFAYLVPEFGTFFRSMRKCIFKSWEWPSFTDFLSLLITEACSAVGSAIFVFIVLPELDVIKGAMLTNAVCFVPGVVAFFSRNPKSLQNSLKMIIDLVSIVAQATSFIIWPLLEERPILYMIPVSVLLMSVGWWENFVASDSSVSFIAELGKSKKVFKNKTYFLYIFISLIKSMLFLGCVVGIYYWRENNATFLFDNFYDAFTNHGIHVREVEPILSSSTASNYDDAIQTGDGTIITTSYMTPIWVWIINFMATYICFAFGKFGCKVMMQGFTFAFPVNLTVPVLLSALIAMCGTYLENECAFTAVIPEYLFFIPPPLYILNDFVGHQYAWIWLVWLLSQAWITVHIWTQNNEKLASTEKLFIRPMYDAFLIDQSLALNRRRDEEKEIIEIIEPEVKELDPMNLNKDKIPRVFACGTMWHETKDEMMEFLKSVFRLDQDQCANRIVRNYLQLDIKSYYELETHVFFDDAYVRVSKDDNDPHVNEFVILLVSLIDEAASKVHGTQVRVRPPKIYPTPYGGRLIWTLPGKTKMVAHLKDKAKIRAKKRWSQVMYMYYLLGHRLMANDEIRGKERKQTVAENTYILALDGDIDFQPEALHLLVDYMKKNKTLGAACGRIHPVGSGGMVWYQMFEYAVGHWLQKATEHVIGCVLCSPGCFSLFRGSALMDHSVMRKYTTRSSQAAHYVQYDQGEDRWLCTLLLQRGYRVEYSAASDAFTHCPEGFNEFYNQRRRWMPSTMANIMDLLMDYEHTVKINDNISMLYIGYQVVLLVGTVLGPGSIFLMLVGAFVAAFGLDQWSSFIWNAVPILVFIMVCATCNSDVQLFFAGVISAMYGLIMMAVFVGVCLQISQDGFLAPSSLFFFCMAGEFIIAAILHPKEFNCLKYGVVYYVTVPSMYMLLVIYSVFNMNNVSWGTREVTVLPQANAKDAKAQEAVKVQPKKEKNKIMSFLGGDIDDDEGAVEFSLNKLFKCMLCTYKADPKEDEQLTKIQESLNLLTRKIDDLEKSQFPDRIDRKPSMRRTTIIEGSKGRNSQNQDDLKMIYEEEGSIISSEVSMEVAENSWFYDGGLIRGEVHYLTKKEETFWNDLLDEYLHPIEDDKKKMAQELKDLRDKMVFTFLMLNSLFVLVVFLLTLEKDTLHLDWPINPKVNFTFSYDKNEIRVTKTYLMLEPIGFVFLIFFAILMVVQFIAMAIHRFGTFSQILSNTQLDIGLFKRKLDGMTASEVMERDPLTMVKDLQRLRGINDEEENFAEEPVQHRKTVGNLAQTNHLRIAAIGDNDKAFHMRVNNIMNNIDDPDVTPDRRKSVAFINQRRQTIDRRQSRLPPVQDQELIIEEAAATSYA